MGEHLKIGAALGESDLLFGVLADAAPVMIWISGLDKLCTFFNKPWLDFTGRSMEQERGNGWAEGVHPEDLDSCLTTYNSAFDGRRAFQMEYRLRSANGEYRWILDNGRPLYREREFAGFIGSAIDVNEQKLMAEEFRVNETRLLAAQRLTKVGSWERRFDVRGSSFWSEEMFQILGITPDHPPSFELFLSRVHPEDRGTVLGAANRIRSGTEPGEYRIVRPDGQVRFVRTISEVLRNQEGEPVAIVGATQDITEQKRAEKALRESEARVALAQSAAQIGAWDSDFKTNLITIYGHYARLHGLAPDRTTITREEWLSSIHPDDREQVDALRREEGERGGTFDAEFRVIWPDGSTHWVHAKGTVLIDDCGRQTRSTGVIWDISERKHAEAALRESEERFRRVFEEGPLGLALVGRDYRFLKVNSALCQMVGYAEEELIEKTFVDITHPDDVAADAALTRQLFNRTVPVFRMQKRFVKKTGEIIWINLTGSTIRDQNNEPLYGLAMIEDVTEVRRAHDEALVRQKLESLGTLAGGIAHDFNNLLGSVHSLAELASGELDAGSSCREELKSIREAAMRGSEIVRQLMIYAGHDSGDAEVLNLSKIVGGMLSLLRISVNKRARIEALLEEDLPPVRANAAQIRQIVMNLITNASDAIGDREGLIRVITRRVTRKGESMAVSSGTLPDGDYVQLEVSDTGCGISPAVQAKVFDPFFSTKSAGRGLGLSVVKGAVRSLGGAIHLESEPGDGTTFRVSLRCEETASTSTGRIPGVAGPEQAPSLGTVLVAEDQASLRQPVAKMLRRSGFEVIEAADGDSAIELIRSCAGKIDLMLLDLAIAGASSSSVVSAAIRARPDIRVIVTSAYDEDRIKEVMREGQLYTFIRKPFQIAHLIQTLRETMSAPE